MTVDLSTKRPAIPDPATPSRVRSALGIKIAALFLGLGTISALKGLNLIVPPTASYLYYTDYRFGFISRGLIGEFFSPILVAIPKSAHSDLMIAWHYATLAILLVALSWFAAQTVVLTRRADVLAIAALLFCSPWIPSLAYFTAQPDPLLCLLTLALVAATRARRFILAWLIFLIGVLVHQLMIFIALPVMVLAGLFDTERRVPALAAPVAVGLIACLFILLAPAPDERLVGRFIEFGISPKQAQILFEDQLGQSFAGTLGIMPGLWRENFANGAIAVAYGASAGIVILAACLLSPGAIGTAMAAFTFLPDGSPRAVLAPLVILGAGLSPLLVLAFAWDLSRLASLTAFTAFLMADMLLRRLPVPASAPRCSRLVAVACGGLATIFLCLPFLGLWFTGSQLNTGEPLVPDPILENEITRRAIGGFLEFYGRNTP